MAGVLRNVANFSEHFSEHILLPRGKTAFKGDNQSILKFLFLHKWKIVGHLGNFVDQQLIAWHHCKKLILEPFTQSVANSLVLTNEMTNQFADTENFFFVNTYRVWVVVLVILLLISTGLGAVNIGFVWLTKKSVFLPGATFQTHSHQWYCRNGS